MNKKKRYLFFKQSLNFTYLNKINSKSGALACNATRSGDERPQDSIGISMNLQNEMIQSELQFK